MSQIRYHNVEVRQQEMIVLEEVNLEIQAGDFVYLIGKVGSGKSSLLKTIYGELDVHSGNAEVLGYDMAHIRRKQIPALRKRIAPSYRVSRLPATDRPQRERQPGLCTQGYRVERQAQTPTTHRRGAGTGGHEHQRL